MLLLKRQRRLRSNKWSINLFRENNISASDFILPIFITDGKNQKQEIKSMPDVYRYSIDNLTKIIDKAIKNGLPMIALFPYTKSNLKNHLGTASLNPNNLVCKACRQVKKKFKHKIGIMGDGALDPYTSHGHDGIYQNHDVVNDETIKILFEQSIIKHHLDVMY